MHQSFLDQLCSSLLACISQSAIQSLPLVKSKSSAIPGWNEAVRSLKSKTSFWHKVWLDHEAGSPSAGILHQIKLASKCRYKYEVRRLKHQSNLTRRKKLASALASSKSHSFWKEVKKINRSQPIKSSPAPVIDATHDDSDIAALFSNKLSNLLSCDNHVSRDNLLGYLSSHMTTNDLFSVSISSSCVCSAFKLLKPHKRDGTTLMSDHLILAEPVIADYVATLLPVFFVMVTCH